MIKKLLYFLILFLGHVLVFAQEDFIPENTSPPEDRIEKQRNFDDDLSSKYDGNDFKYKDHVEKREKRRTPNFPSTFLSKVMRFFTTVFPYLLALIVIFIVVKALIGEDFSWFFSSKNKKIERAVILTSEEESYLENENYEKLIVLAKQKGDYRNATRYYYLLLLKQMSNKGLITFDKDKTNTEYIFDLQKKELRKPFSYLLYIYDYVWYGEFDVNQTNFSVIESNYESFLKQL
ncbi:hypothetical protein [Tenacibaculum jejuense]|uniref:DUF4129 domain-containing protein n=1 Tax=Tenacibaculum jejuense TaxID=584609 RepID=A0A238U9V1_9FLAO|nr:hypothetical protein [Tenacibaculum jejuense]SNR15959.1 Probable transmembrane protein of unknown function [Tenacibaculum jejuense]